MQKNNLIRINQTRFFFSIQLIQVQKRTFKSEQELIKKIFEIKAERSFLIARFLKYTDVLGINYEDKVNWEKLSENHAIEGTLEWSKINEQRENLMELRKRERDFIKKKLVKTENKLKSLCFKYWFRKKRETGGKIIKNEINYQNFFINGIQIEFSYKSPLEYERKNKKTKKIELFVPKLK